MDLKLKNKIALITGASKGLGYAAALGLAKEGCKVAINARDEKSLNIAVEKVHKETGTQVVGIIGDVSLPDVPAKLIEQTVNAFGGLDILVTNTGGSAHGSIDVLSEEQWQKGIDLYLMSHVRLIKSALPFLKKSDSASVLTITSIAAIQPIPSLLLSNSIRAGTLGLTKSLALDHGKDGIRFNSIIPSWTLTERVEELLSARAKANNSTLEEEAKKQANESVFGRMATPEEFANAAVFLVSPAASYITGVMLSVDGGSYKGTN